MTDLSDVHAFCFTGFPGSGKSEALTVAKQLGIPVVSMGDRVREGAREAFGPDFTDDQLGKYATQQRNERGPTWVAERTTEHIQSTPLTTDEHDVTDAPTKLVIDGVRSNPELEYFRDVFGKLTAVYIYSPSEVRLDRISNRDRDTEGHDDDVSHEDEGIRTMEDLKERDDREGDWGLYRLVAYESYDIRITNKRDTTLDEFHQKIQSVIEQESFYRRLSPHSN